MMLFIMLCLVSNNKTFLDTALLYIEKFDICIVPIRGEVRR